MPHPVRPLSRRGPAAAWAAAWLLSVPGPGLSAQAATEPSFQAFVFGDVQYVDGDGAGREGFQVGQTVLHGNAVLSDRVLFFAEVTLTGRDTGYGVEVERAILRYDFGDALKVSAGRYHTPVSFWNTAYHHGLWLQGSVARPEPVRFGTTFIPVHFVGGMAEGRLPDAPLTYRVGLGNGRAANIARAGDAGDVNGHRAVFAEVGFEPASLFGARIGASVYVDRIANADGPSTDERLLSAHAVWNRGDVDFVAEYIRIGHEPTAGSGFDATSDAAYAHLGYRLGGALEPLRPYLRWETMDIDPTSLPFAGRLSDYDAWVGGVRWDFSNLAALKLEYRREERGAGDAVGSVYAQGSFAVPLLGGGA